MTDETHRDSFATSGFARFIAGGVGRALRVAAGLAIIATGLLAVGGTTGYAVAAAGLIPLLAGGLDFCLLGPLFGAPFSGPRIRDIQRRTG